jgi:sulfur carrier protein
VQHPSTIEIIVNGKAERHAEGTLVRALIEARGLGGQAVAAEVNQKLVPRSKQESHVLLAGDRVELVSLVGGG